MKKLLRAGARARTRLFGAACALHWRVFGPEEVLLIEVDDTEGVSCNMNCEAVGGPYECLCVVSEDRPVVSYTACPCADTCLHVNQTPVVCRNLPDEDPQDAAEKVEPYAFDQDYDGLN